MARNGARVVLGGVALALALALAGCGGGAPKADAGSPAAAPAASPADGSPAASAPTGEPLVIEPASDIAGARRFDSDGVSVLVPKGWTTARTKTDSYVQLDVYDPQDKRNPVTITVGPGTGATSEVDLSASVTKDTLGTSGATGMQQRPATWEGWKYATALTGSFDEGDGAGVFDFLAMTLQAGSGAVVGVTAQAPQGTFDGSLASQVLSSVKDAS